MALQVYNLCLWVDIQAYYHIGFSNTAGMIPCSCFPSCDPPTWAAVLKLSDTADAVHNSYPRNESWQTLRNALALTVRRTLELRSVARIPLHRIQVCRFEKRGLFSIAITSGTSFRLIIRIYSYHVVNRKRQADSGSCSDGLSHKRPRWWTPFSH